ncbi:acetolactate synthase 3 large subunit [Litorivicinus lipolyticus]|uniref:Acetolactate synthase n=1 Tax=Litorivicinus lipolyticus TaxID=418701 RepID=A0A5Q2Q9G1_9GAMM|nr:acetolactate synthase 3 large subunit [Litorivicinus lipolyticus]QGG80888.1 acetolactate synthase 3 large subunit [Litorivicinus lipolyticus]
MTVEHLSGGEMIMRSLKEEGVDLIFGYPGGSVLHIYDALYRQDAVEHILVRHEQAAVHAADGYARSTGKTGVVLVTSGPGATNAITGIATAYMDSIPLVVISGNVPSWATGTDFFQETDMIGVSRPIVKHSFMVQSVEEIPSIMKKAFMLASTGRPGPVVIDVPKDMTAPADKFPFEYPESVRLRSYSPATKGHSGQIRKALELLLQAKRPVIYAGGGTVIGDASAELTDLARKLGYPVTNTLMGLGSFPGDDGQFIGMLGMHGFYEANMAMHNADVIFAVGARFDDRVTNDPDKFCPGAKFIHIDIDPASIQKTITEVEVPIVGPTKSVLTDMLAMLGEMPKAENGDDIKAWWDQIEGWRAAHGLWTGDRYVRNPDMIMPQDVVKTLYEVTGGDAYVCSDVGQHQMFAAQYYKYKKPRQWINSGGLGTMGFGLPAAMGVQFAHRDSPVAVVTGEGSIQMCIQELSACAQYALPIKIININNEALGMVRQWQDMQYGGRYSASTYQDSLPDFVKLAEAYGHVGMRVSDPSQLKKAMQDCFALKDKLVFLDILVDPSEHVYPMQIATGSMRDMWVSKTERT